MKLFFKILILFPSLLFSQELLEERISYWENGKKMTVNFKNYDFEIVRIERYSPDGELVSSFNYNPKTGRKNGDFINGDNKGFYNEGVLNSDNYTFTVDYNEYNGSGIFWNAKIVNGRPVGDVIVYQIRNLFKEIGIEETSYPMDSGDYLNFYRSKYLGLGLIRYGLSKLFYNESGELEGKHIINRSVNLYFDKGDITGLTIKNEQNPNVARDSVFKKNKIWKVFNRFVKNNGIYSSLKWNEFEPYFIDFYAFEYDDFDEKYKVSNNGYLNDDELGYFNSSNSDLKPSSGQEGAGLYIQSPFSRDGKPISIRHPLSISNGAPSWRLQMFPVYNNPLPFVNDNGIFEVHYFNSSPPSCPTCHWSTPPLSSHANDKLDNFINTWLRRPDTSGFTSYDYYPEGDELKFPFPISLLANDFSYYDKIRNFSGVKDLMFEKLTFDCELKEYLISYINITDLLLEDKNKLIGYINELDCTKEIPYIKSLSVLNKIINSKLLSISDFFLYDSDKHRFVDLSQILAEYEIELKKLEEIEIKNEQIRIETEDKRIEDENIRKEEKAEFERKKNSISRLLPNDFDYSIENHETFGKVLLIKFYPRKNKMQILNEIVFDEFKKVNPIGYSLGNSSSGGTSLSVYINSLYTNDIKSEILKLNVELDNEKKKKRLLNKLNKDYSKFKRDKWFGYEEKMNPENLILDQLSIQEWNFPNEVIIASWLRNELFRNASALYFPEYSFGFGGYLLPNEIAIFRDPESNSEITHYFNYNYPNLSFNNNVYQNNENSAITTISDRYSSILLRSGNYWNSNDKSTYRTYTRKDYDDDPSNDIESKEYLSFTSSDFEAFFTATINKNPMIVKAYKELFGVDISVPLKTWAQIQTKSD